MDFENNKSLELKDAKQLVKKLEHNYKIIKKDNDLTIFTKILLLINIFLSDSLKYDDEIKYCKLKFLHQESPLFLAVKFLKEFIDELDYESNFYYPLLLIDGGLFEYIYPMDTQQSVILHTFGINMNSLEDIKAHLKELIPDIIVYTNNYPKDDYSFIMGHVGIVNLNLRILGNECIQQIEDENIRKHKGFILSKVLFHEIFGHKKNLYSSDSKGKTIYSPSCFKDKGILRFLPSENESDLFKDVRLVDFKILRKSKGDSGYFLEFFFGKIDNEYTLDVIEEIEDETQLGVLLNANLWHREIDLFKRFIKLKKYLFDNNIRETINNNNAISEQINEMEILIQKEKDNLNKENPQLLGKKRKINFFEENQEELQEQKKKRKKAKKKKVEDDDNILLGKHISQISIRTLYEEASNPSNYDKIIKFFPNLFQPRY